MQDDVSNIEPILRIKYAKKVKAPYSPKFNKLRGLLSTKDKPKVKNG